MKSLNWSEEKIQYTLSSRAVRESTAAVYQWAKEGHSHFQVNESKLAPLADYVIQVIRDNYPDLQIPYHSRWGHFRAGNKSRLGLLYDKIGQDPLELARAEFDLAIPSILLDAGAGAQWKFRDPLDKKDYARSEGLGVASFYMFMEGAFSTKGGLRADAEAMRKVDADLVAKHFQVSPQNPLVGLEGRAKLVSALGKCIAERPKVFKTGRPGDLVDYLESEYGKKIQAPDILKEILRNFGGIWPGRISAAGVNLGDAWMHSHWGEEMLVVFHKLSQWMSYSLFEPLERAGFEICNANQLTGLAEYRNGGLFVDGEVITLKDSSLHKTPHAPDSDLVIEWRALTVQLLDLMGDLVREKLGFSVAAFPLAKVLEGGTWWAGRRIAQEKRNSSEPPIQIISDGTVF